MDTMQAFAKGEASRGNESMVFDWDKAAKLIRDTKPVIARAGLQSDWEWTGGDIYKTPSPVSKDDTYTFLASTWATPELEMDDNIFDCFIMENEAVKRWGQVNMAHLFWPKSALDILNTKETN